MLIKSIILTFLVFLNCLLVIQAQVPYPAITAKKIGPEVPLSPDPLIGYRWKNPKATDGLESYVLYPIDYTTFRAGSFDLSKFQKEKEIKVSGTGSIRFDFGRTSAGWLEFDSDDLADSITLSISEYNEPAILNAGAVNRFKTKAPVKRGNTYRLELNNELYEGVRFGWINIHTNSKTWHIRNPRLVCQIKPTNYQGSFSASDSLLTRIWYTGAYTVKVNFQKDYFGAILMERSDRFSWTGDAYPAQAASLVAFGNFDFVKSNLKRTELENNGILSYSLYWVLSLIDYVNYSGDVQFAKSYIPQASSKLDSAYQQFDKPKYLVFYGWDERLGAGFENPNIAESQYAYAMLSIKAWLDFGQLMQKIGEADLAKKYIAYAHEKIEEARSKTTWPNEYGLHASADAINTGLTSAYEDSLFYNRNFTDRVHRISYSPFNQFFIINAMAKIEKFDEALSVIKDCWGEQIKYGGTTFFEVFHPSWNSFLDKNDAPPNNQCGYTSLAHPWSSGVVKWLSEETLGIKPLEPGFKTFQIIPHLGTGLDWVEGSSPTPHGQIAVYFNISTGISEFTIPPSTTAKTISIPLAENTIQSIYLNKKRVWQEGKSQNKGDFNIQGGYFHLNNVKPGKYHCKVVYNKFNKPTPVETPKWAYHIEVVKQDSITTGDWNKKYGSDGFILFNYKQNNENLQQLPDYASSIVLNKASNIHLEIENPGNNILLDTAGKNRHLGAIVTQDPLPTMQTMTIDLTIKGNQTHQLALYFLDWDNDGRRSAVEIHDLNTLKLLAPVQEIHNYQKGKYLVFDFDRSVRIRVNHIRGQNAAVSGIFFDSAKDHKK